MVELTKPVFIMVMVNIFLVVGGYTVFDNGIAGRFIEFGGENNTEIVGAGDSINSSIPRGGSFVQDPGGTSLSLIDGLGALLDVVKLIANIILAPLALFSQLPSIAQVFVAAPLLILNVFGYISFIRSGA